jgi:hypothetical protein
MAGPALSKCRYVIEGITLVMMFGRRTFKRETLAMAKSIQTLGM